MKNFRSISILVIVCLSCCSRKPDVIIKIDSNVEKLDTAIVPRMKGVYGMQFTVNGTFDDTIIWNGLKCSPPGIFQSPAGFHEYYGSPVEIKYDRFKAKKVDLIFEFEYAH